MACRRTLIAASLAVLLAAPPAQAQGAGEPTGIWQTQAGDARVKISKCGGGICGIIVSLREPIDPATGRPQVDNKNPIRRPAAARSSACCCFPRCGR